MNDEKNVKEKETCPSDSDSTILAEESTITPLQEAQAKTEELHDKYLRLAAEMENLRRRTDREIQDIRSYSITAFARDMLAVSDNLSRALESIPVDVEQIGNVGLKSLIEGVEMTKRAMMSTLERHGVKKLEANDQKFDPNFHQAMFEEQNEKIPTNTVIKVVQEGYVIGDRVLRPALVGISKSVSKPCSEQNPSKSPEPKEDSPAVEKETD
ncbi:nucleotide exchange factor GrpE [Candidatus Liberibacter sp.]|uniref:nucleotide exchange factor GrpE n=1 Tax=Candidatus Liberibacter sp. TaxID=34022 RepID=UPI0015F3BF01|nr:nucleotide exchange factor GrpE [Candidatus Liberibacter sp.]MBA5723956.1 nucleotide exchange factor GrpE [Candidatus Liberibacter sp.]